MRELGLAGRAKSCQMSSEGGALRCRDASSWCGVGSDGTGFPPQPSGLGEHGRGAGVQLQHECSLAQLLCHQGPGALARWWDLRDLLG